MSSTIRLLLIPHSQDLIIVDHASSGVPRLARGGVMEYLVSLTRCLKFSQYKLAQELILNAVLSHRKSFKELFFTLY